MADTSSTSKSLKLLAGFTDEDDRTLTFDNPIASITSAQINNLNQYAANVLIGDKYAAPFSRFKTAKIVETEIINYDLDE